MSVTLPMHRPMQMLRKADTSASVTSVKTGIGTLLYTIHRGDCVVQSFYLS